MSIPGKYFYVGISNFTRLASFIVTIRICAWRNLLLVRIECCERSHYLIINRGF